MADHPQWFVGDRNPAISDTVTIDGVGVDLTSKTVTFKMRAVGSTTLKVNAAVTTKEADGDWTYGWGANDLDTAGQFLVWVTVDMGGGALQTVNEALITVAAHAPLENGYVELEEFKSTAELTGTTFADSDLRTAILAASRGVDQATGRRFWPDADATQVRYYSPDSTTWVAIDDLITLTQLATDRNGTGSFSDIWTANTDFVLEPLNAVADGIPYQSARKQDRASLIFPAGVPRSVKVTGKFGWAVVPAEIKTVTKMIASRLIKRTRESPLGFAEIGFEGAVVRAVGYARDPDYQFLIGPYTRNSGVR